MLFLFGNDFAITARLASIMILALPLILLNAVYLSRAIAVGATWVYLGTYLGISAAAITLDILLARSYGGVGVAFAIVARELLIFSYSDPSAVSSRRRMVLTDLSYASQVEETIDV